MAALRAGLIGLGMMGRHHGRILAGLDGVELVAVCDAQGDPHGVAKGRPLVATVEELLTHRLDYAMVAVPTAYHVEVGTALADAGVHAMVEKPLAQDAEAAQRLADAFAAAGLIGAVGHIERFNPALQQARRRLEDGELGQVYQVVTRRQSPFPARISDVGVVMDLATHDIDLTAWVTQQAFTQVAAHTAYKSGRQHEDLVAVTGRLADGTVTSHLVNWLTPFKERVTVITGERGAFVVDTLLADLTFHANGSTETPWEGVAQFRGVSEGDSIRYGFTKKEPLLLEHEAFRDAVLGKASDVVTMAQGVATVRTAQAVLESARLGRTVEIGA